MEKSTITAPLKLTDKLALLVATGVGVGYCPVAPGTVGSFLGIILILLLSRIGLIGGPRLLFHLLIVTMITALGIWAASRSEVILR